MCIANDRGRLCTANSAANSKWCPRHEELQAKSLKSYKRLSVDLESYQLPDMNAQSIQNCCDTMILQQWATTLRQKWILTKRTIEARTKHHQLFYSGGDASHQAFINTLISQQTMLERMLLAIDDRAYALLLLSEKAEWLDTPVAPGPRCDEPVNTSVFGDTNANDVTNIPLSVAAAASDLEESGSEASLDDREEDGTFSDISAETDSSVSCTSACCQSADSIETKPPTALDRLLAYLNFPLLFDGSSSEAILAATFVDNLFRYVISRIPRLLVRARSSEYATVRDFLNCEALHEDEYGRLWRAMKYNNIHQEGKITVGAIRTAICDAETGDSSREGACINLLGGKVWKTASTCDLSDDGWNLFFRFTSCSGCALSATHSFASWSRNRTLSGPGQLYASWSDPDEAPAEAILRSNGVIIAGSYRKAKTTLEHVKPKAKGMKSVWIERESRNWCLLRLSPNNPLISKLKDEAGIDMTVWIWPVSAGQATPADSSVWVSRLRTGNTPYARKQARWTTDASFRYNDCTRQRLLSTSPETYFHSGEPFDSSVEMLVIDTAQTQCFQELMRKTVWWLGLQKDQDAESDATLNDKATFIARQMFRESSG